MAANWDSSLNRWEITVVNDEETTETYTVTEIIDDEYQLSEINHVASPVDVEWKTPIIEEPDEEIQGGIPGFPTGALVVGILLVTIILYPIKRLR